MQTVYQGWNVSLRAQRGIDYIWHLCVCVGPPAYHCCIQVSEVPIAAYCNIQSHTQPSLHTLQYTVSYTTIATYAAIYSLIHNHRCIRYNIQSHTQPSLHTLQYTVSYTTNIQVSKTNSFSPSSLQRTQPNPPHIDQAVGLVCWTDVLDWRVGLACWTGGGTGVLDWLWD